MPHSRDEYGCAKKVFSLSAAVIFSCPTNSEPLSKTQFQGYGSQLDSLIDKWRKKVMPCPVVCGYPGILDKTNLWFVHVKDGGYGYFFMPDFQFLDYT